MRVFSYILFLGCLLGLSLTALAQGVPPTCDVEYYNVLSDRAWMESERRMEMAQKLLLKPDSVLQYVCFNKRMEELDSPGADWSNIKADMKSTLDKLVKPPLDEYLGKNFNHTMGGGSSNIRPGQCDVMYKVWTFLKCVDFDRNDFMTFDEMANYDPRQLPSVCPNQQQRRRAWQDAIDAAYPDPDTPARNGGMDERGSNEGYLFADCTRQRPIPTGVMIVRPPLAPYEEKVCITPGCSWERGDFFCH